MSIEMKNEMAKIAVNKSLLKEFTNGSERTVYMTDGTEFQIMLFNPKTTVIGAEISINGVTMDGKLVLKPGERVWLERYFETNNKFKFSTYEVEDSSEAKAAIAKNGVISIKFYEEDVKTYISHTFNPLGGLNTDNNPWGSNVYLTQTVFNNTSSNPDNVKYRGINAKKSITNDINTASMCYNADLVYNGNTSATNNTLGLDLQTFGAQVSNTIETGRVDKGSHSSQDFDEVDTKFKSWSFATETIHILPSSQKLYTANDAQRVYCTNCGRKLNPKYKFCPFCGAKCE